MYLLEECLLTTKKAPSFHSCTLEKKKLPKEDADMLLYLGHLSDVTFTLTEEHCCSQRFTTVALSYLSLFISAHNFIVGLYFYLFAHFSFNFAFQFYSLHILVYIFAPHWHILVYNFAPHWHILVYIFAPHWHILVYSFVHFIGYSLQIHAIFLVVELNIFNSLTCCFGTCWPLVECFRKVVVQGMERRIMSEWKEVKKNFV